MLTLTAKSRTALGGKNDALRDSGSIPAVLYGPGIQNENLSIDQKEFEKMYRQAGKSSLIELNIEGGQKMFKVLINDVAKDPLSDRPIHADLYQPDLTKEIEAEVPLVFEGESLAVKDLAGTLVKNISQVTVKALPDRLPREIKVDIGKLKTFDDSILVKDLVIDEGVKVQKSEDEIVAIAVPVQKVEEELEKPIEEKVEEVAQVEKEKKDVVTEEESEGKVPKTK